MSPSSETSNEFVPNNEDALRLSQQTFLFSEFLQKKAPEVRLPILHRKALVQAHCHHAAVINSDEEAVLKRLGLDYQFLETGCCGMAGSLGYEKGKYDVSVRCGERGLLPRFATPAKRRSSLRMDSAAANRSSSLPIAERCISARSLTWQ